MFLLRRPDSAFIARWLDAQRRLPFSYADVGALGRIVPHGYDEDRLRVRIGSGSEAFAAACDALGRWAHFPSRMARVFPRERIAANEVVAVLFRAGPFWSLNACRIIEVIDERATWSDAGDEGEPRTERFGFSYGTLTGHLEHGEEHFLVERDPADDSVWYELHCFSRPQHPLAQIGRRIVRMAQGRFRRLSGEAMRREVTNALTRRIEVMR